MWVSMNQFRVIIISLLALLCGDGMLSVWGDSQQLRGSVRLRSARVLKVLILNDGHYRLDGRGLAVEVSTNGILGYARTIKPINIGATKLLGGNVAIVWESFGEDRSMLGIMGTEFDPMGDGTSDTSIINQYTEGDQSLPFVECLAGGSHAVVWQSYGQDGSSWGIYERVFNVDSSATDENVVPVTNLDSQRFGVIAALPAVLPGELPGGGAVVVWRGFVPDGDGIAHIFLRFISADGTVLGDEIQVDGANGVATARPSALTLKDGSGVFVSWVGISGYIYGRFLAINDDGTMAWNGDPLQISQLDSSRVDATLSDSALYTQYTPVTIDSTELTDGTIIVTWLGSLGDSYKGIVYGIPVNPSTGAIDVEFVLSSDALYSPSISTISTDNTESADNVFVVGWSSDSSTYFVVGTVDVAKPGGGYSLLLSEVTEASDQGSLAGSPVTVLGLDELTFVVAYSVLEGDGRASIVSQAYEVDPSELILVPPTPAPTPAPTEPPGSDDGDDGIQVGGTSIESKDGSTLAIALGVSLGAIALIAIGVTGYIYYRRKHKTLTPPTTSSPST